MEAFRWGGHVGGHVIIFVFYNVFQLLWLKMLMSLNCV